MKRLTFGAAALSLFLLSPLNAADTITPAADGTPVVAGGVYPAGTIFNGGKAYPAGSNLTNEAVPAGQIQQVTAIQGVTTFANVGDSGYYTGGQRYSVGFTPNYVPNYGGFSNYNSGGLYIGTGNFGLGIGNQPYYGGYGYGGYGGFGYGSGYRGYGYGNNNWNRGGWNNGNFNRGWNGNFNRGGGRR